MPKDSLSLYFAIQTSGLDGLTSLTERTKALDKETQQLAQAAAALKAANDPLAKSQQELQMQLEESAKKVQEARKAFRAHADDASKLDLSHAIQEQNKLKNSLKLVTDEFNGNEKQFKEYVNKIEDSIRRFDEMSIDEAISDALGLEKAEADFKSLADASDEAHKSLRAFHEEARKADLQESGSDVGGGLTSGPEDVKRLALGTIISKLGGQLADAAGDYISYGLSSAIGLPQAELLSGTASGLISGATTGAMFGLPGVLLGGLAGAAAGGLSGYTQIKQAQDDAFKAYYKGLYDQFDATEGISGGSTTAAGRETDLISLATMFGDKDAATEYLRQLVDMSNRTPFLYSDLMGMSKTLATYGYDESNILPVLQTVGDAGAALGQSVSDMNSVATALGRMQSSDKATLEYLNILNDRGINAVGYLAEARGKSVADTYTDISKGNISGTEAVRIILDAMEEAFGGSMEVQSGTFSGLSSTLEGLRQEIDNAAGEGYNTLRGEGIQEEIDALGGPLGEAMEEMNSIIGQNQAYLENLSEQYQRAALDTLFNGTESGLFTPEQQETLNEQHEDYLALKEAYENGDQEAGLKLQNLYELTQETAQGYYESSDIMQAKEDTEIDHLAAIRENTKGLAAALYSYREDQEASKGMGIENGPRLLTDEEYRAMGFWDKLKAGASRAEETWMPNAFGLNRVPYNDYPALLHEGERVLTAREAREMDKSLAAHSFAFGLDRAPRDDYPALLHEGERVLDAGMAGGLSARPGANEGGDLTALLRGLMLPARRPEAPARSEAAGGGSPVSITVTGNDFVGTGEEMADQVAEIIARKLERAAILHQPR